MNYAIGDIRIAFEGSSPVSDAFERIMEPVRTDVGPADLVFVFVDRLPDHGAGQFVSLDDYEIAPDRLRFHERLFSCELCLAERPVTIFVSVRKASVFTRTRRTTAKTWRYFHTHGGTALLHHVKRFIYYVYMPLAELVLLKNNTSFSHCSAIEKHGRAVLFPAWGGVGKTSIMSRCLDEGWQFLSDDSCVLGADGMASIHPVPMHIYKYHEIESAELVKKMLAQASTVDRFLWRFLSKVKKPDRLVRWVGAHAVFGPERISASARISAVIHMHRRMGSDEFMLEKASPEMVARLMASTILDEVNNLVDMAIVAHSCRPMEFIPDISTLHRSIVDIYTRAFSQADCAILGVPKQAAAADIYRLLHREGLLQ